MRPGMLLTLVFTWMAIAVWADPLPGGSRQTSLFGKSAKKLAAAPEQSFAVTGDWRLNRQDAEESALQQAQADLVQRLKGHGINLHFPPPTDYIEKNLVRGSHEELKEVTGPEPLVRVILDLQVTPDDRIAMVAQDQKLLTQERESLAHTRMLWLAKLLVGVVALLVAVAGYLRLEDSTKGYCTGWLRAAAVGFLAVAAMLLLFFA